MQNITLEAIVRALRLMTTILLCSFVLVMTAPGIFHAESLRLFRIGTGGRTGVYYPIGKIIAQGITHDPTRKDTGRLGESGVSGYIGVAQNAAGSVYNINGIIDGEIEAALVQADIAAWASQADRAFMGNERASGVRAIASLYSEKFQIVTRRDAGIKRFDDLRGKRISIDEIGSGTLDVMRIVLEAYGMTEEDLQPVYLKPVFTHDKIISGDLQGFVMMAGVPMPAVSQLSDVALSLVPIEPRIARRITQKCPYLVPGRIPAGIYPGVPEIPTIEVYALLVVNEAMTDQLSYQITAALWSQRTLSLLKEGHPQGKFITPDTALVGIPIPLHPGAKKYYQEYPERFTSIIDNENK